MLRIRIRVARIVLLTSTVIFLPAIAQAQLATSPSPETLPAVTVTTSEENEQSTKKAKAPAAAQQSSMPGGSEGKAKGTPGQADTSDVAVSPTGLTSPVDQIASSVTVITSKEIEAQQRRTLPDVLKTVPGLNVVQTGGPGGLTSIFMRGTNSNHVKVLIDGIDVSDPSNANRSFDFGQMLTADIERVEVLRGPQSGLYGADALGGVIVIYTKKGEGPPKVSAMAEGGSFGTFNQALGASGSEGHFNYAFNVIHFRADDTPVTPVDILPPGVQRFNNSYDNWTYSTKLGAEVMKDLTLNFVARYTDATLFFTSDGFAGPNNFQTHQDVQQFFTRGEAVWTALGGHLTSYIGINFTDSDLQNHDPFSSSFGDGDRIKYDWRSVLQLTSQYTVVTGADYQNEQLTTQDLFAEEWNRGTYVELQSEPLQNFFLVANARHDENQHFGGATTWRVAPAYVVESTGTKLKGSVGTAFKAPTLSQRFQDFPAFFFFGNRDLQPEESIGYDAGFEQPLFSKRAQFGVTYFHNDITNLIQTNDTFTTVINIGKATTSGIEAFASADLTDNLVVRTDYTYTKAIDDITQQDLLRRPRNKASVTAGWTPYKPLLLTATVLYVGKTPDVDRVTFDPVTLPSFTLVNVAASYQLNDNMNLFGRIDNLFDKHYENPDGFLGTGIGAYAGIKFTN
jgi:vitamin B12 transporter